MPLHWLCTVDRGVLQWAASGTAAALIMFGFSLGMRQGYKAGKQARVTLDALKERVATGPTRPAA